MAPRRQILGLIFVAPVHEQVGRHPNRPAAPAFTASIDVVARVLVVGRLWGSCRGGEILYYVMIADSFLCGHSWTRTASLLPDDRRRFARG